MAGTGSGFIGDWKAEGGRRSVFDEFNLQPVIRRGQSVLNEDKRDKKQGKPCELQIPGSVFMICPTTKINSKKFLSYTLIQRKLYAKSMIMNAFTIQIDI
jgi:hypothetical protein